MKKAIIAALSTVFGLFGLTVVIYWFNLDTKVVAFAEPYLNKWYDGIERDRKL